MLNHKKIFFIKIFLFFTVLLFFVSPGIVRAITDSEKQVMIEQLTQQISELQEELIWIQNKEPWCYTFEVNLKLGDNKKDVEELKTALIKEEVMSYQTISQDYDKKTFSFVSAFQEKYASEILTPSNLTKGTGFVGTMTRKKLNQLYGCVKAVEPPVEEPSVQTTEKTAQKEVVHLECKDEKCSEVSGEGSDRCAADSDCSSQKNISFAFELAGVGWKPIAGDWDYSGTDSVGVYDPEKSAFYLKNTNEAGKADIVFVYGSGSWLPIAGDWDGDKKDTIGLYDSATSTFYLKNSNTVGYSDITFGFGTAEAGWKPIAGDWNGDGTATVGLYDSNTSTFYLKNSNSAGTADVTFTFGTAGWLPVAGDWNGDGTDTIGLYDKSAGKFYLKNSNSAGKSDINVFFINTKSDWVPISMDWYSNGKATTGVYDPANGVFYIRELSAESLTINKEASEPKENKAPIVKTNAKSGWLANIFNAIKNMFFKQK